MISEPNDEQSATMEASERYTGRAADPRGRSTGTYTGTPSGSGVTATGGDKRWLLLGVIALAQLMIVLDATIIDVYKRQRLP